MRLALAFGEPDVGALQRRVDSAQFAEWIAYERMSPLGPDERVHELLAGICTILVAANSKKGSQRLTPEDFMPWRDRRRTRPRLSPMEQELTEGLKALAPRKKRKP